MMRLLLYVIAYLTRLVGLQEEVLRKSTMDESALEEGIKKLGLQKEDLLKQQKVEKSDNGQCV